MNKYVIITILALLGSSTLFPIETLASEVRCDLQLFPTDYTDGRVFEIKDSKPENTISGVPSVDHAYALAVQACEKSQWFFESKDRCNPDNSPATATIQCFANNQLVNYFCDARPTGIYSTMIGVTNPLPQYSKKLATEDALNACNHPSYYTSPDSPPRNCVSDIGNCREHVGPFVPTALLEQFNTSHSGLTYDAQLQQNTQGKSETSELAELPVDGSDLESTHVNSAL